MVVHVLVGCCLGVVLVEGEAFGVVVGCRLLWRR
jgi:hypothetical protein